MHCNHLCIWICVVDLKGGKVPPFYRIFETFIHDASFQLTDKQANKQRQRETYRNMQHSKIPDIQVGDDHSERTRLSLFFKKAQWGGTAWIQRTWIVSAKLRVVQMSREKRATAIQISVLMTDDDNIFKSFSGKLSEVFSRCLHISILDCKSSSPCN